MPSAADIGTFVTCAVAAAGVGYTTYTAYTVNKQARTAAERYGRTRYSARAMPRAGLVRASDPQDGSAEPQKQGPGWAESNPEDDSSDGAEPQKQDPGWAESNPEDDGVETQGGSASVSERTDNTTAVARSGAPERLGADVNTQEGGRADNARASPASGGAPDAGSAPAPLARVQTAEAASMRELYSTSFQALNGLQSPRRLRGDGNSFNGIPVLGVGSTSGNQLAFARDQLQCIATSTDPSFIVQ